MNNFFTRKKKKNGARKALNCIRKGATQAMTLLMTRGETIPSWNSKEGGGGEHPIF